MDTINSFNLAVAYAEGDGIAQDFKNAFVWRRKTANQRCWQTGDDDDVCWAFKQFLSAFESGPAVNLAKLLDLIELIRTTAAYGGSEFDALRLCCRAADLLRDEICGLLEIARAYADEL